MPEDAVEVSTVVHLPPAEVYEFLVDFPRYANYSKHLTEVRRHGDGSPGTEYDLVFSWWKLSYTARSRVTATDPPERIDWEIIRDLDARGYWGLEPADPPAGVDHATRVRLYVEFRPETANRGAIDLPAFVSFSWVIEKVKPLIRREAERICRRIVADLEGEPRHVELDIHQTTSSV